MINNKVGKSGYSPLSPPYSMAHVILVTLLSLMVWFETRFKYKLNPDNFK